MRHVLQFCFVLSLLATLALIPGMALAQTRSPNSDTLQEAIDGYFGPGVPPPPPISYTIPEAVPEALKVFLFPGREINFLESSGAISDRLSISPYQVAVQSDDEIGLVPRANAVQIPASALEQFEPLVIVAMSEVDGFSESDNLRIYTGGFGGDTGTKVFDQTNTQDGAAEPALAWAIQPVSYDVYEPGNPDVVSDYVDILGTIQVRFISSDDPATYANLPAAQESVFEVPIPVAVYLTFESDVPEPATMVLLILGAAGVVGILRRIR